MPGEFGLITRKHKANVPSCAALERPSLRPSNRRWSSNSDFQGQLGPKQTQLGNHPIERKHLVHHHQAASSSRRVEQQNGLRSHSGSPHRKAISGPEGRNHLFSRSPCSSDQLDDRGHPAQQVSAQQKKVPAKERAKPGRSQQPAW